MKHSYIFSGLERRFGDRNTWLKILALILIGVAASPEIGFAMEMTTLLEILGVTIFFLSFRVGAKMLLMDIAAAIRNFVCPPVVSAMNRPNAIVYTTPRTYWLVMTILVTGLYCLELAGGGP
jgi:hypothetical protein